MQPHSVSFHMNYIITCMLNKVHDYSEHRIVVHTPESALKKLRQQQNTNIFNTVYFSYIRVSCSNFCLF